MVLVFYLFLFLLYLLLLAQPGGLEQQFIGNPNITPEAKAEMIARLGLDLPWWQQVFKYMAAYTTGNMGVSWSKYPTPVVDILLRALPRTLYLFLLATILAYTVGFVTGKLVAWKRDTLTEKTVLTGSIVLYTVFYPWFALLMLWFFSVQLKWFPLGRFLTVEKWLGSPYVADEVFMTMLRTMFIGAIVFAIGVWAVRKITNDWHKRIFYTRLVGVGTFALFVVYWLFSPMQLWAWDIAWHSVIPVVTLTLVAYASVTLLTRSSMLEAVREDYILTARAKGVPDKDIRDRHASRNALLPVVTSMVLALATVIGGGIITETVFSWPGVGLELLAAITAEDIPLALGGLSVLAILSLVAHLVADLLYAVLDPRIRFHG